VDLDVLVRAGARVAEDLRAHLDLAPTPRVTPSMKKLMYF
jgi:hypothetical protein